MGKITIPSTSQVQSQTGPTLLNRTRATGADFGGEAFGEAAKVADQFAVKAQDQANRANLLEATNKVNAWTQQNVYGKDGYLATAKGKNAFGGSDKILKDFDQFSQSLAPGMTTESQKIAFQQAIQAKRNELQGTTTRHEVSEFQKFSQSQDVAAIENAKINMANNYNNPEILKNEMSHLTAVVHANAQTNGLSNEQLQVNLLKEKSSAVSGVVNRALADNDYSLAKGLFEANKTNLLPEVRDRLQKSINVGNNRARSQAKTDQIMSLNLTKEEALKKAREIKNPEIRDDTVARVKARYGEIEQVTLAKDKQTSSNVAAQIEGGQEVNIPMLTGLDDSSRTALTNYQTKLRSGEAIETNPATKADLDFMATDNPNAFLNTNLYAYRDKLSNKDFNDLLTKQTNAIEGTKTKKDFSPKSLFSDTVMVKNAAGEFGIIDNTKTAAKQSGEAKRRYYDFQQMADEELMSEQEKKGEALTDAEKQTAINKVAARFAIDVKEKGWIYDSDKKLGDLTTEQLQSGDYYLSDEKERNRLKIALINIGVEPTEQNIITAKIEGL